ncbi:NAD-dependent epimerase/dehydratase family protein [Gammaproteobacteria bacterium]|nr:NAD-dependent epimerase/dehydratase family protein [Gammaproteobacteria bacterium]
MNIAISGFTGFIGNNLTNFLDKYENIKIILISRNTSIDDNSYSYNDFFSGNIGERIDLFIHLASPNYDYCKDDSLRNGIVVLTENILRNLENYDCKKFIYFSSCKVYGESSMDNVIYSESSKLNPISDYAKAKAEAESIVSVISLEKNINFLIYRLPFVYGNRMKSNLKNLLNIINKSAPFILIKSKSSPKKSFVCVNNINKTLIYNIENPHSINNSILNLSDNSSVTLNDFLNEFKKVSNSKTIFLRFPIIFFIVLSKIPIFGNIILKIYGGFDIDNSMIKKNTHLSLLSTSEGIQCLDNK